MLAAIEALEPLAPLHQPQSIRLIKAIQHLRPNLPQTASFDTAFHRSQSDLVRRFALPRALFDEGVKRYGFHGLQIHCGAARADRAGDCQRPSRRGASGQRRETVCSSRRYQPRHQHGLLDVGRHSDGDPLAPLIPAP
jgi:hypothetical protein